MIQATIFLMFAASYSLVLLVVDPLQAHYLTGAFIGSILYLPHGVRIVATWLFRERAVLPLILCEFGISLIFWMTTATLPTKLLSAIIGGSSAYVVLRMFEFSGIPLMSHKGINEKMFNWRSILLVSVFASFINSLGKVYIWRGHFERDTDIEQILALLAGDTLGCFAMLLLAMLFFRYRRAYASVRDTP